MAIQVFIRQIVIKEKARIGRQITRVRNVSPD
jgi:hypothetical protein